MTATGVNLAVSRDEGVVTVVLDWAGSAGPVGADLADDLTSLLIELGSDATVRAVVIAGTGDVFATGRDDLPEIARMVSVLQVLPFLTIAAVQRVCIGAGLALALACRQRVFSADAVLCATPGTGSGGTARELLCNEIGHDAGRRLLSLGAIAPADLVGWGVNASVVPDAEVLTRAQELAGRTTASPPQRKARSRRTAPPPNVWQVERPLGAAINRSVR